MLCINYINTHLIVYVSHGCLHNRQKLYRLFFVALDRGAGVLNKSLDSHGINLVLERNSNPWFCFLGDLFG